MDKDVLEDGKEEFKLCSEAEADQRKASLDDLEFALLGKQWPEEVSEQRKKEARPCLTINRMPAFTKQVTNDARQSPPSIVTKPVGDKADKETSAIFNDVIRNIETVSQADIVYGTALDFAVNSGIGYFRVLVDYSAEDGFDQSIFLSRVANPFSVYGDYEATEATSIDWNRAFVTDLYSKAAFKKKWPGAEAANFDVNQADESTQNLWFIEKMIRVAEWWRREEVVKTLVKLSGGEIMFEDEYLTKKDWFDAHANTVVADREAKTHKVTQKIISGCDVLEENDWLGKYIPIVPMYGEEINVEGKRHFFSLVRRAKDAQRMFNYWRTASTELVALAPKAPYIGPVGAFATDSAKWGSANTSSYPYIEFDVVPDAPGMGMPQRQPFAGVPAGALQEALNASDDMKAIMGLHDASLGAKSNETSGRAIMARQREGDVSTFNFIDNRNRAVEHGGRIMVDLIPKVMTGPQILRCIKEDGTTYNVPVNQPVQVIQSPNGGQTPQYQPISEEQHQAMQAQGQMQGPMMEGQEKERAISRIFDITAGKYDVVVLAGPSYTTKREESAEQMMEFIRIFPQSAPLIGDLLAKNLDWPGAEEVAARLKAMLPPQAAGQVDPMVQRLQGMLQQQDGMAKQAVGQLQGEIKKLTDQLQAVTADKSLEAAQLKIDGFKADTDRIKVDADIEQKKRDAARETMQNLLQPHPQPEAGVMQ